MAIVVGREAAEGRLHLGKQAHARVAARTEAWLADTPNKNSSHGQGAASMLLKTFLSTAAKVTHTLQPVLCVTPFKNLQLLH